MAGMSVRDLCIDFEQLEVEEWDEELEGVRSSTNIISSSFTSITNGSPFLDYSSFLAYASTYGIDIIPYHELTIIDKLGSGAVMTVFRGACPSRLGDAHVALKRLNLELPQTKSALPPNSEELYHLIAAASLEVRVLTDQLLRNHPNIVDLLAVSWEELGKTDEMETGSHVSIRPILIVELACRDYPTLDEYFRYSSANGIMVDMDTKISILSDIADALSAVHTCGVIHGDIKPQNILIFRKDTDGPLQAKLADFGGCQPPADSNDGVATSSYTYPVLGTEYWNAPEVPNRRGGDITLAAQATRDYYSMGLLIYYVLFGEMPFGNDQDGSDKNLERIAKLKDSPSEIQDLVRCKMVLHWPIVEDRDTFEWFVNAADPTERVRLLRRLYIENQAILFVRREGRKKHECRQFLLYLVMRQFLHTDPKFRQAAELMGEFRLFLQDDAAARTLKDVYLMGDWDQMQSDIDSGVWNLKHLNGTVSVSSRAGPRPKHRIAWKSPQPDLNSEIGRSFDFDKLHLIPDSLRAIFIQELNIRSRSAGDPRRIPSLLALEVCRATGYGATDGKSRWYSLEAAQLGSVVGKYYFLATPPREAVLAVEPETRCSWILDTLLCRMPRLDTFRQRIFGISPEPELLEKVLLIDFTATVCRKKTIKHIFTMEGEDSVVDEAFAAVVTGQITKLKTLLQSNRIGNIDVKVHGFNLLHVAAEYGHRDIMSLLVRDFSMNVNELNDDLITPIALAARASDHGAVVTLLQLGADFKPLLYAQTLRQLASYGSISAISQLHEIARVFTVVAPEESFHITSFLDGSLALGPTEEQDDSGPRFPPIFGAILGDNIRTFWKLLDLGCSQDIYHDVNCAFIAPIHVAANMRPLYLAILLHYGALPDLRTHDKHQSTALHLACKADGMLCYDYPHVVQEGSPISIDGFPLADEYEVKLFMVQLLVKGYGAGVNAQDWYGRTAVSLCMTDSHGLPVARYLVEECKADIHLQNFRGLSCLHLAVLGEGGIEYLQFCITHGVKINAKDINGYTALILASHFPTVKVCQYLLDSGADLLATHNGGWTCLHFAIKEHQDAVAEYLFNIVEKRQLLTALLSIDDTAHHNLIHRLIYTGRDNPSKFLPRFAKHDISPLLEKADIVGYKLLHHAALAGDLYSTEFLLQLGANVNAKGWRGLSALHIAYARKDQSIIEMLESNGGIDLGCVDLSGRTAEDLGKICNADPEFWHDYVTTCNEEGDQGAHKIDQVAIEDENRRKGAPRGGWWAPEE